MKTLTIAKNVNKKWRMKIMNQNDEFKFSKIVMVGAGGIGFHLAVALSRDIGHIIPIEVWDDDTFEGGQGFRRLPAVSNKRQFKVEFLKDYIERVMDDKPPTICPNKLTSESLFLSSSWAETLAVDCTDMGYDSRKELWAALRKNGATCLRVSYDGNGCIVVSPSIPFSTKSGAGGYSLVPSMGQSYCAAGLGAMAVMKALRLRKLTEMQLQISDKEEKL